MDELQLEHADLMIQKLKDDLLSLRSNPELVANQRNSIARDYFNERDKNVKLVAAATLMAEALEAEVRQREACIAADYDELKLHRYPHSRYPYGAPYDYEHAVLERYRSIVVTQKRQALATWKALHDA